jgi:hypothetical protein
VKAAPKSFVSTKSSIVAKNGVPCRARMYGATRASQRPYNFARWGSKDVASGKLESLGTPPSPKRESHQRWIFWCDGSTSRSTCSHLQGRAFFASWWVSGPVELIGYLYGPTQATDPAWANSAHMESSPVPEDGFGPDVR